MTIESGKAWRLGTIGSRRSPRTVLEAGGQIFGLDPLLDSTGVPRPSPATGVLDILDRWDEWRPVLTEVAAAAASSDRPLADEELTWLPPVPMPRKVICVGANYRDHLLEMGQTNPQFENPFAFVKPTNTLLGHRQVLTLPSLAKKVDWEGELGVVIGRRVRNARGNDAMAAVAGYCPFNDISARDWIDRQVPGVGMDWILHKSFDGFGPVGPLITPAELVADPQNLAIQLAVNGVMKQDSSTAQMIFGVKEIIEHLSSVMTLEPGDIISTGSPAGVGHSRQEYLQAGDVISLQITGLGELVTPVVG